MAKKRAARVANQRGVQAPRVLQGSLKTGPAKLRESRTASEAIPFSDFAGWAAIFFATFIAYLPALNGGLLWDDDGHLTRPDLQSFHGLWRIWTDLSATQQYYPLLHTAFWLEHRIWGEAVVGYHLTNLVLYALSACLVVLIVRRLSLPGAWLAGFVFALHPVHVEGVAWIAEQKSTLSGVFCLASLLIYLNFDRTRRKSQYLLATGLFVLALASKTVTATLPAVLLVIFWWQRGRLAWKRDVLPLIPWLAIGASAGILTAWVENTRIGARGAAFVLTPAQRILIAGRAIWFYAGKLLWPADLIFSYPRWNLDPAVWWQWLFPAGVVALAIGLGLAARRSHRGPLAGLLIFAGTLFPVLGFLNVFPFRYSYVADHFQYLASLGIIVPLTSWLMTVARRTWPEKTVGIASGAVLLLLVLGVMTWRQSGQYRDVETLYRETLARNPDSYMAHSNLGEILAKDGQTQDAIAEYEAAVRIEPGYAEAHDDLGVLLAKEPNRLQDGIAEIRTALRFEPDNPKEHFNLGLALAQTPDRLPEAIAEYQAALRLQPDWVEALNNLGNTLAHVPGRLPEAITAYRTALRIRPDLAELHYNLGFLLSQTPGGLPEAIAEYQAALRIEPNNAETHTNLANALSQMPGRIPDAIAEYQIAVRLRPDIAGLHYNLGLVLDRTGRLQDAISEYAAALRISPDFADAHFSLGSALARSGRRQDAITEFEAVLRITPDSQDARRSIALLRAAQR